jgi:hypothetical protein
MVSSEPNRQTVEDLLRFNRIPRDSGDERDYVRGKHLIDIWIDNLDVRDELIQYVVDYVGN